MNSNFNSKTEKVQEFINLLKSNRAGLINPSDRQLDVYDELIKNIENAPRSITLKDVRTRFIIAEDDMFCACVEESDNQQYVSTFTFLWSELRRMIREEASSSLRDPRELPCCAKTENSPLSLLKQYGWLTDDTKKYFDGMIDLGFMKEGYLWKCATKNPVRAYFISKLAKTAKLPNQWKRASEIWGIKTLISCLSKSNIAVFEQEFEEIDDLFKI